MNDQVKKESVENTASQNNAGINEVSNNQDVENKVFSADQLEQIVHYDIRICVTLQGDYQISFTTR